MYDIMTDLSSTLILIDVEWCKVFGMQIVKVRYETIVMDFFFLGGKWHCIIWHVLGVMYQLGYEETPIRRSSYSKNGKKKRSTKNESECKGKGPFWWPLTKKRLTNISFPSASMLQNEQTTHRRHYHNTPRRTLGKK